MSIFVGFVDVVAAVEAVQEVVEGFESDEDEGCGDGSQKVHASTAGHADGCCHPDTGSGSESAYGVLLEDDGAGTDETDASHHLGSYA